MKVMEPEGRSTGAATRGKSRCARPVSLDLDSTVGTALPNPFI